MTPVPLRFQSVQVMRAIAVFIVMLHHIGNISSDALAVRYSVPGPLYFGYAGVDLFFVISGFIIAHVTRRDTVGGRILVKRFVRILPFYWVVTLFLAVVALVAPRMMTLRSENFGLYLAQSLFLAPTAVRPLLGVGWTLQHEFIFYFTTALLMLVRAKRLLVFLLLALFLGRLGDGVASSELRFWDWKILSLFNFQFALGVLLYKVHGRVR